MELKEYQQTALGQVKAYLEALDRWRAKNHQAIEKLGPEMALDFPLRAWDEVVRTPYRFRKNGVGESLPNFCLKIPTGGGKTLLAVKAIDLINAVYRKRQTGLVLWVVPTTQIYRQTLQGLRDRDYGPKLPDEYRVLLIGDSFTFGHGLETEETISRQLEDYLAERVCPSMSR